MNYSIQTILAAISLLLGIIALIRPQWPLCAVAVVLLSVALLVR